MSDNDKRPLRARPLNKPTSDENGLGEISAVEAAPIDKTVPPPETPAETTDPEWMQAIAREKAEAAAREQAPVATPPTGVIPSAIDEVAALKARIAELEKGNVQPEPPKAPEAKAPETVKPAVAPAEEPPAAPAEPPKGTPSDVHIKQQEIAEKNNISNRVFTDIGSDAELAELMMTVDAEDTRSDEQKEKSPSDALLSLELCRTIGMKTKQQRMLARFILELEKNNTRLAELEGQLRLSKVTPRNPHSSTGGPVRLTGEAAKIAVLARTQGLYRIMLYNSGFWITVRPMSVEDMNKFVKEVDADFKQLGRIIGGQFHMVLGVYLKHKVLELLPNMIVSSNLEEWEDPAVLGEAISIHDYDTILWGICCSVFRDGVGVGVYCTGNECRHNDNNQFLDLTKACYVNPDVFNEEAMRWMINTRINRTLDDCIQYRNEILKSKKEIVFEEKGFSLSVRVPSLLNYADRGIDLVGKMEAAIYSLRDSGNDERMNQITFHLYRMLAPWISRITYKNGDEADTFIEEYDAICLALEAQVEGNIKMYDQLEAYIRDTKCSIYCFTSLECPKCGKKPDLNSQGLFPVDVEYLFFGLSCLKLEQTGARL